MYKFLCENPQYTEWSVVEQSSLKEVYNITKKDYPDDIVEKYKSFNPLELKLMNQDVFMFQDDGKISVCHSTTKKMKYIPGILKLEGNKTYGKIKDKYYYRCYPDDRRFPEFLIPYKVKDIGYYKKQCDLFVIFNFKEWTDKHPVGTLCNTIGEVDKLDNFYEYQLYCKSLYSSIQNFKKATVKALKLRFTFEK